MSFLNTNKFQDRQAAAAAARKAMAERFASRPKYDPTDPKVVESEAARRAVLEARAQREIERARQKAEAEAAEAARKAAEEIERAEQEKLEALQALEEEAKLRPSKSASNSKRNSSATRATRRARRAR